MKNTLLNMILVLGGISLAASAGVGYVYKVTEEPIAVAAEAAKKMALSEVLPEFDDVTAAELTLDAIPVVVNTATSGGVVVGYAVETATNNGFSGQFKLMVGFEPDGKVRAVKVLQHAETPGLGSKMTESGNVLIRSFEGRNPAEMNLAVKKDGGDVDALTAATITSRAYADAVARAFNAMMRLNAGGESGGDNEVSGANIDAATGATTQTAAPAASCSVAGEATQNGEAAQNCCKGEAAQNGKEASNE